MVNRKREIQCTNMIKFYFCILYYFPKGKKVFTIFLCFVKVDLYLFVSMLLLSIILIMNKHLPMYQNIHESYQNYIILDLFKSEHNILVSRTSLNTLNIFCHESYDIVWLSLNMGMIESSVRNSTLNLDCIKQMIKRCYINEMSHTNLNEPTEFQVTIFPVFLIKACKTR